MRTGQVFQLVCLPLQLQLVPGLRGMKGWKRLQVDFERMKARSGEDRGGPWTQGGSLCTMPLCPLPEELGVKGEGARTSV